MILLPIYMGLGLLLGPTGIALQLPSYFPVIFKWCAAGFLLNAGLECSLKVMRDHSKQISLITLGAFAPAFIAGFFLAPFLGLEDMQSRWVIATALSVSALPVVVQILKGAKLLQTKTGQVVIAAASVCDIIAWIIFLAILPADHQSSWIQSHFPVLFFFMGIILNLLLPLPAAVLHGLDKISRFLFAPLFFIGIGLQINLWDSFDLNLILIVFAVATIAKTLGVVAFARFAKTPPQEAWMIAVALNARGAMEILLAMLAFQSGLINKYWLTTLIVMALATSFIANPLLAYMKRLQK